MPDEIEVPLEHAHEHIAKAHEEHHGESEDGAENGAENGAEDGAENNKDNGKNDWSRSIAVVTALLAVVAAIGALKSGVLVNGALIAKNDEISHRTRATDQWNFYQAKSIKGVVYSVAAAQAPPGSALADQSRAAVARYAREQEQIKAEAESLERRADVDDRLADRDMSRHHMFAFSVSLCQIAIAISAVAALTRRRRVWLFGLATGVAGIAALIGGFLGLHLPFEF